MSPGEARRGEDMRETQIVTGPERLELFGPGPWVDEPDRVEWWHEGVPCLIARHRHMGHWCGYVGVSPRAHPWHGKAHAELPAAVHGSLTWSGASCDGMADGPVWWIGFDCGHLLTDLCPLALGYRGPDWSHLCGNAYRDRAYVTAQVIGLAKQVIAARPRCRICHMVMGHKMDCPRARKAKAKQGLVETLLKLPAFREIKETEDE